MRVAITGSCGFIGSALVARHLAAGDEVTGLDSFDGYYARERKEANWRWAVGDGGRAELHELDVADYAAVAGVLGAARPEVVVHLAARAGVLDSEAHPEAFCRTNVLGTSNVLEACARAGVRRVVVASSSSVYGGDREGPTAEGDPPAPRSVYATSKLATESLAAGYAERIGGGVRCLRFFTVYGPRQRPDMAFMKFLRAIESGREIQIRGAGMRRDFSFVEDIVDGILAAERDNGIGYECFNLGSSRPYAVEEVVAKLFRVVGRSCRVDVVEANPVEARSTYADISRAQSRLGFAPRTSLEDGLRAQHAWYMEAFQ